MSPRLYTGSMRLYGLLLNKLYIKRYGNILSSVAGLCIANKKRME